MLWCYWPHRRRADCSLHGSGELQSSDARACRPAVSPEEIDARKVESPEPLSLGRMGQALRESHAPLSPDEPSHLLGDASTAEQDDLATQLARSKQWRIEPLE